MHESLKSIPVNSVRRLPGYLRLARLLLSRGREVVSSSHIATDLDLEPIQVRKDLQIAGVTGRPKTGYYIPDMIEAIENFLGWNEMSRAFLAGAGNLGAAIIGYKGFAGYGLDIAAAFDSSPELIGTTVGGRQVLHVDKLTDLAQRMHPHIGIITVPAEAAQAIAELMYFGGIRAIWNFAPVTLSMPDEVIVENVYLSSSLAVLTSKMRKMAQRKVRRSGEDEPGSD
jgi:redox-sensing transcriptional repressor